MNISLAEAAKIISKSEDELMFFHQINRIQAGVDQETLAWEFKLSDILDLKSELEKEAEESLSEEDEKDSNE